MKFIPYLNFYGKGQEVLEFYKEALNGEIMAIMRYKDEATMNASEEVGEWILHSGIIVNGEVIYISDILNEEQYKQGNNISIMIDCDTEEQIRTYFEKLSDEATINMPLEHTFWGALYGSLIDKFGVNWDLNYQIETY
jgi:PhnB protein